MSEEEQSSVIFFFLAFLALIQICLCEMSPMALSQQTHLDKPFVC